MKQQKILIKGMVCDRCIISIKKELQRTGIEVSDIYLGEATIIHAGSGEDMKQIDEMLNALGFSIIEDKREKIVKQVKGSIKEVYSGDFDFPYHFRFSSFVAAQINKDYDLISAVFSEQEGTTIEKCIIDYRIEKVKEFLVYSELTLADISFKLGFSSVAHLSRQFKSFTGLNPSYFKSIRNKRIAAQGQERQAS